MVTKLDRHEYLVSVVEFVVLIVYYIRLCGMLSVVQVRANMGTLRSPTSYFQSVRSPPEFKLEKNVVYTVLSNSEEEW